MWILREEERKTDIAGGGGQHEDLSQVTLGWRTDSATMPIYVHATDMVTASGACKLTGIEALCILGYGGLRRLMDSVVQRNQRAVMMFSLLMAVFIYILIRGGHGAARKAS